ncbi:MAG: hypothetical protein Q8O76_06065 [Chloroflexota bacterium]|nr:hypothetical protein [Chloroflexota bacterium]
MLRKIADYEDASPDTEPAVGWSWRDVRAHPTTLNRMEVEGLLETVFKANSCTCYRLTEKAKAALTEGAPVVTEEAQAPWNSTKTCSKTSWATRR